MCKYFYNLLVMKNVQCTAPLITTDENDVLMWKLHDDDHVWDDDDGGTQFFLCFVMMNASSSLIPALRVACVQDKYMNPTNLFAEV